MRIERPTYSDRNGKAKQGRHYHLRFRDHNGIRRTLKATTDKDSSTTLAGKAQALVNLAASGERPGPELARWIEAKMPATWRPKLTAWGVLDGRASAAMQPLAKHLEDYVAALRGKGNVAEYVETTKARISAIMAGCGFRFWTDISASAIELHLAELQKGKGKRRGIGRTTANGYLTAFKGFCGWCVRDGRAVESPIAHLKLSNAQPGRRRDRRALAGDELARLLDAAHNGPERYGIGGPDRAMTYRVAVETGLRRAELASLTRRSFDLDGDEPTVSVEAAYSKHRRRDELPLRPALADALRGYLAGKHPGAAALRVPSKDNAARMIRADLDAARAAWLKAAADGRERDERERGDFLLYRDHADRVADFHSLRHTFITNLARSGVHPRTAQALARHSTVTLTMDRYSHSLRDDERAALDGLPTWTPSDDERSAATGTDGAEAAVPAADAPGACAILVPGLADDGRDSPRMSVDNPAGATKNASPTRGCGGTGRRARFRF